MKRNIDLTKGNVVTVLLLFCWPILVGQLFQQLYNTVDSIVVGQFVSSTALAAVNTTGPITRFVVSFFLGVSTGASVLFSRYYASGEKEKLSAAVQTTIIFTVILGAALTLLGIVFAGTFLDILKCPQDVYSESMVYLRIYMLGMLCTALYNTEASILRALGDSQSPFYYLVIASLLNIVLDVFFVVVLKKGIAGVAIATVIAQSSSMILAYRRLKRPDSPVQIDPRNMHMDKDMLKEIMEIGLPAGIQTSIQSIANMVTQRHINSFGYYYVAGIGSAMRIDQFAGMATNSLGLGMSNFIGQNLGARKYDRTREGIRIATVMALVIVAVLSIPIYIFAEPVMHIFTQDEQVIMAGVKMLRTIMPFYEVMGLNGLYAGIVRGFGKSTVVMFTSLFGMVVCRQLWLAIGLSLWHNVDIIYWGYPFGWIMQLVPILFIYFTRIRKALDAQ